MKFVLEPILKFSQWHCKLVSLVCFVLFYWEYLVNYTSLIVGTSRLKNCTSSLTFLNRAIGNQLPDTNMDIFMTTYFGRHELGTLIWKKKMCLLILLTLYTAVLPWPLSH